MIAIICFYILLGVMAAMYWCNKEAITKDILIALAIKIFAITILYFLFFGPAHRVVIDQIHLNNMLK